MPAATREPYRTAVKLPKLHTTYQITLSSPSPSPMSTVKRSPMPLSTTSRELPMPIVSRIISLAQAQATLQHCSTKLSRSWPGTTSPPASPIDPSDRRLFQRWLEQWEQAFTAYLSYSMPSMKTEDISRCRVLKANHLACTILASDAVSQPSSFNSFESELQAIVELAGAVLQSRLQRGEDLLTDANAANALDVREPLCVVVARCRQVTIRNAAIQLLSKLGGAR